MFWGVNAGAYILMTASMRTRGLFGEGQRDIQNKLKHSRKSRREFLLCGSRAFSRPLVMRDHWICLFGEGQRDIQNKLENATLTCFVRIWSSKLQVKGKLRS
jgi:hypothetical protein